MCEIAKREQGETGTGSSWKGRSTRRTRGTGERGEPGRSAPEEMINRLAAELEVAQRDLRVQFTRMAQIQAELDTLRAALKNNSGK